MTDIISLNQSRKNGEGKNRLKMSWRQNCQNLERNSMWRKPATAKSRLLISATKQQGPATPVHRGLTGRKYMSFCFTGGDCRLARWRWGGPAPHSCAHTPIVCVRSLVFPWTIAWQAPLFVEFPRQEYWYGSPFSFQGGLPDPGIKPTSLMSPALAGGFFSTESQVVCIWYLREKSW